MAPGFGSFKSSTVSRREGFKRVSDASDARDPLPDEAFRRRRRARWSQLQCRPWSNRGVPRPDGAGKMTTMRAIFGLVRLDRGEVRWKGKRVGPGGRARFGYMPAERGLYPKMKVGEQLTYFAELSGMSEESATEAAAGRLERPHWTTGRTRVWRSSHGNQQRVQLAAAIVHDPELWCWTSRSAGSIRSGSSRSPSC